MRACSARAGRGAYCSATSFEHSPAACAQGFECQVVHGALELLMAGAVRSIIAEVPSLLLTPTLILTLNPDLGRNLNPNPKHYAD